MRSHEARRCITCVPACHYSKRSRCLTSLELPRGLGPRVDLLNNVQGDASLTPPGQLSLIYYTHSGWHVKEHGVQCVVALQYLALWTTNRI